MSSWRNFENRAGQYIQSLTIDTSFLHTSRTVLLYLNESSPEKFDLPLLTRLQLIIDQTHVELEFARKFMRDTVKELKIEIWEPLPDHGRTVACMRREAEVGLPRFKSNDAYPPYPLASFLSAIADDMPHIKDLSFTMRDMRQITRAWPALVILCSRLRGLKRLYLPRRVLTLPAISSVARYPALKCIGMYGGRTHSVAPSEPYDGLIALRNVGEPLKSTRISGMTELTITASPSGVLSLMTAFTQLDLTVLNLNLSASFADVTDVHALIAAIAEACPALEHLKLCPITAINGHSTPIRPCFEMLHPLRRCRNLVSLEVVSPLVSHFKSGRFTRLVSAWRKLQRLVLDHPQASVLRPQEPARLSIETVFYALRRHCPEIRNLSLSVSPAVKNPSFSKEAKCTDSADTPLPLETACLCIGYPPVKARSEQLARYLHSYLPHICQVELHVATRRVSPVLESTEDRERWLVHHRNLSKFVNHTINDTVVRYRPEHSYVECQRLYTTQRVALPSSGVYSRSELTATYAILTFLIKTSYKYFDRYSRARLFERNRSALLSQDPNQHLIIKEWCNVLEEAAWYLSEAWLRLNGSVACCAYVPISF
ncbi:hypothetical protein EIP86_008778 [Pleurotus ostreatoroseus]|nr:hypothetical protein EIP86_008778 [Pleurotus ostreatoroseus]